MTLNFNWEKMKQSELGLVEIKDIAGTENEYDSLVP